MGASLDAILPLKVDGSYGLDDLHRTDVLMASLSAFFEPELLRTFLVVSPAQEVSAVREYLSQWSSLPVEVIDILVPKDEPKAGSVPTLIPVAASSEEIFVISVNNLVPLTVLLFTPFLRKI